MTIVMKSLGTPSVMQKEVGLLRYLSERGVQETPAKNTGLRLAMTYQKVHSQQGDCLSFQ